MGRTYVFECKTCGYSAKVAGGTAEGLEFTVQTIVCLDCRELQDAVTLVLVPSSKAQRGNSPPRLAELLTRLPVMGRGDTRSVRFEPACTASPSHSVRDWNQPDRCPLCGEFLECSGFPFAQWD
jgi:hypothetical protein